MNSGSYIAERPAPKTSRVAAAADFLVFAFACGAMLYILSDYETAYSATIGAALVVAWIVAAAFIRPLCFIGLFSRAKYKALGCFMGFYALSLFVSMGPAEGVKWLAGALAVFSPMLVYDYYERAQRRGFSRLFVIWVAAVFVYLSLKALYYLQGNRGLARVLAASSAFGNLGIGGGYELTYALCLLIPALIFFFKFHAPRLRVRLALILCIALFFTAVIKADYTLAFIFVTLTSALALCITRSPGANIAIVAALACAAAGLFMIFSDAFGYWLYGFASTMSGYTGIRLQEAARGILGLGLSDDLSARLGDIGRSFNIFLANPLVGQGFFTGFDYTHGLANLGQHSEWMDALGKWGLCGAVPYFAVIICQVREYGRGRGSAAALKGMMLIILAFDGLFNPLFFAAFFAVISVLIPGTLKYLLRADREADEDG